MEKLDMRTDNIADKNYEALTKMFPNAITETIDADGNIVRAIDADVLRQEISCAVVEGKDERYQFTWPDKKKSMLLANAPITATLRPVIKKECIPTGSASDGKSYCSTSGLEFDNTQNLYTEGDNLEALKLLQETYMGKIKVIYIDPPYNTGNDFVYNDDLIESVDYYTHNSGQIDDEGNQLVKNLDSNGRFHTDWLNMLYPRLKIARNLLSEDGVIFVSIDDYEQENLKKCCDEIFGAQNFITQVVWERSYAPINMVKHFSKSHDYILCYAKSINEAICNGLPRPESTDSKYSNPDNDPRGLWRTDNLSVGPAIADKIYEIVTPSGRVCLPPKGRCWLYTKERYEEMVADNRIWFGEDGNNVPAPKRFLSEVKQGLTPMTIWKYTDVGHTQDSMRELRDLFSGEKVFDYSKPIKLMKQIIRLYSNHDDIILDFFSGSASTAHAVMELNAEDGANRRFIMMQLPEITAEKSDAYKAGYKNICEIGKERIRRAGKKILEEHPEAKDLDVGFRVLKLDSSNMKDVYYNPAEVQQTLFDMFADNIKEDRTPEDLLFQVMLDLGVLLSSKIEETTIAGKKVFNVADGFLIACFDNDVTEETVKAVAEKKPYYAVFRDSSMANDSVATNFDQIFEAMSPDTVRKVL